MPTHDEKLLDDIARKCGEAASKRVASMMMLCDQGMADLGEFMSHNREFSIPTIGAGSITVKVAGPTVVEDWRRLAAFAALAAGEFDAEVPHAS